MAFDPRRDTGRLGESAAVRHLERSGYRVVERNFRTREGELDVIAIRDSTLVFCEVKSLIARAGAGHGPAHPLEGVDPAKRLRIRRMARTWLGRQVALGDRPAYRDMRFDAIGVLLSANNELLRLEHVEDAF